MADVVLTEHEESVLKSAMEQAVRDEGNEILILEEYVENEVKSIIQSRLEEQKKEIREKIEKILEGNFVKETYKETIDGYNFKKALISRVLE